jgi:hypothetical protein
MPANDYPVISFILEVTGMKIETLAASIAIAWSLAFAASFFLGVLHSKNEGE